MTSILRNTKYIIHFSIKKKNIYLHTLFCWYEFYVFKKTLFLKDVFIFHIVNEITDILFH